MSDGRINNLLQEILISTHRGSIYKVAEMTGYAYRSIHDFCHIPNKNIPTKIIKAAFLITKDPRLKLELEPQGYELVVKKENLKYSDDFHKEISDVNIKLSTLLLTFRDALKDEHITKQEKITLKKEWEEVSKELAEVGALIDSKCNL